MRVALDINGLYTGRAGVARYLRGLLEGFATLADPELEVIGLAWPVPHHDFRQPRRALRTLYRETVWAHAVAPARLRRAGAELLHLTSLPAIRRPPGLPLVATLCDLAPLRRPTRFRPWHRAAFRRFARTLRRADMIICISQFTADEARALLDVDPARLVVVACGGGLAADAAAPDATLPPGLPADFVLFVGTLEPGKNLALLRDAYARARAAGQTLPPLAIVGARWQGVAGEIGPEKSAPPPDWHYLGWQPDPVLQTLYRRALALVFPSRYEGFGLPVLEAMQAGCPVICSPVASLPEVAGDAARWTDLDPDAYLEAIREVCTGPAAARADWAARGRARAAAFSWRACAADTAAVYRRVRGGSHCHFGGGPSKGGTTNGVKRLQNAFVVPASAGIRGHFIQNYNGFREGD